MKFTLSIAASLITLVTVVGFGYWGGQQVNKLERWKREIIDSARVQSVRPMNIFMIKWNSSETIEDLRLRMHEDKLLEYGIIIERMQFEHDREYGTFRNDLDMVRDIQDVVIRRDSMRVFGTKTIQPIEFTNLND